MGRPETSSAWWRACSFSALKSCHTAHSPVTLAVAPAGSGDALDVVDELAGRLRAGRRRSSAASSTGTSAVRPSGAISPALGGRGERIDHRRRARGALRARRPACAARPGPSAIGSRLVVDDDRGLGAGLGEVPAQLVADLLGGRALGLPPGPRQRARQGERQRRGQHDHDQPTEDHRPAATTREPGQPRQQCLSFAVPGVRRATRSAGGHRSASSGSSPATRRRRA